MSYQKKGWTQPLKYDNDSGHWGLFCMTQSECSKRGKLPLPELTTHEQLVMSIDRLEPLTHGITDYITTPSGSHWNYIILSPCLSPWGSNEWNSCHLTQLIQEQIQLIQAQIWIQLIQAQIWIQNPTYFKFESRIQAILEYTLKTGIVIENGNLILKLLQQVFHSQIKIKCVMKLWIPLQ